MGKCHSSTAVASEVPQLLSFLHRRQNVCIVQILHVQTGPNHGPLGPEASKRLLAFCTCIAIFNYLQLSN